MQITKGQLKSLLVKFNAEDLFEAFDKYASDCINRDRLDKSYLQAEISLTPYTKDAFYIIKSTCKKVRVLECVSDYKTVMPDLVRVITMYCVEVAVYNNIEVLVVHAYFNGEDPEHNVHKFLIELYGKLEQIYKL